MEQNNRKKRAAESHDLQIKEAARLWIRFREASLKSDEQMWLNVWTSPAAAAHLQMFHLNVSVFWTLNTSSSNKTLVCASRVYLNASAAAVLPLRRPGPDYQELTSKAEGAGQRTHLKSRVVWFLCDERVWLPSADECPQSFSLDVLQPAGSDRERRETRQLHHSSSWEDHLCENCRSIQYFVEAFHSGPKWRTVPIRLAIFEPGHKSG